MYEILTRCILVVVEPVFLEDQSRPEDDYYVWAYNIQIENRGKETVQLRTRHWIITDSNGKTEEVRGEGVVGEQPILKPGECFQYTSGVPLPTSTGFMNGSFQMQTDNGEMFDIIIPTFSLDDSDKPHSVH